MLWQILLILCNILTKKYIVLVNRKVTTQYIRQIEYPGILEHDMHFFMNYIILFSIYTYIFIKRSKSLNVKHIWIVLFEFIGAIFNCLRHRAYCKGRRLVIIIIKVTFQHWLGRGYEWWSRSVCLFWLLR